MNRAALEHLLRAASAITNEREFIVIGSQAILGQFPNAPASLLMSVEADLYPRHAPEHADLVDGALGELSAFHQTFGYYAHGVDASTAVLPPGWDNRLVRLENENTGGAVGWCLEAHDVAASKLVAGREQDNRFIRALLAERLVDPEVLHARVRALPLSAEHIRRIEASLRRLR